MFAEIGHLICSIQFGQEKRNHFVQLWKYFGLTRPIRYVNVNIFFIYKINFAKFPILTLKIGKREENKSVHIKISFFVQFFVPIEYF